MTPASMASEEVIEERKRGFIKNVSTSHWPHRFVMGGWAMMDTPDNDPDQASKEQRALIGFDRLHADNSSKQKPESGRCNNRCHLL